MQKTNQVLKTNLYYQLIKEKIMAKATLSKAENKDYEEVYKKL